MNLNVYVGEELRKVEVPDDLIFEAEELLQKMDADMNKGWQMSRIWVDDLNQLQRCQVVADRMLTALEGDNFASASLMAAYIISRMPGIQTVHLDTDGDMTQTELEFG